MIYLIARKQSGEAICPAEIIKNRHIPERRYPIVEHVVTLDKQPEPVLQHDWMVLCSMPDGEYRPMQQFEQNAYTARMMRQSTVEE